MEITDWFLLSGGIRSALAGLGDEARAVALAHLRAGMDTQAKQGLTWVLQVLLRGVGDWFP